MLEAILFVKKWIKPLRLINQTTMVYSGAFCFCSLSKKMHKFLAIKAIKVPVLGLMTDILSRSRSLFSFFIK